MKRNKLFRCILVLVVCAMVLSLPVMQANAETSQKVNNRFNVVVLLDASGSNRYTDPDGYRYEAIRQFTSLLAERGNVLGGVVFNTTVVAEIEPKLIAAQAGKDDVIEVLESIPGTSGYTNIGAGIERAVEMLEDFGNSDLPSVIVFLSDGNTEMPDEDRTEESLDLKAEAIQEAREDGVKIYSICLNANDNADVSEMKQISDATGGVFAEVNNAADLQDVFTMFYNLIYGTSTIPLVDEVFPDNGILETTFEVPGLGVEEVNIVIYGNTTQKSLLRPNGEKADVTAVNSSTFSTLKLTDVEPGTWTLVTEGVPGDSIKINMVYNTDLDVQIAFGTEEEYVYSDTPLAVTATLIGCGENATSSDQYVGYEAQLQILDAYGDLIETVPMEVVEDHFEAQYTFPEGAYFCKVLITGNYVEMESEQIGPMTSILRPVVEDPEEPEPEPVIPVNNAPVPVEEVVEAKVNIWPFKGGSYTLDLNTLATDAEDTQLRYKIESTSFIEGEDFTVDADGVLHMDHFSLSKGAFTISATDSGGLSCQIEVIVKSINIGLLTLIGLGIAALIGAIVFGVLLYIALSKPFRGTISAQSYCNGTYKGVPRSPRRGREKLARFQMDAVGLDYQKSYFQATGDNYIFLVTNRPVVWNGQKTNKVRIQSGAQVTISMGEGDPRQLHVRFDSRMTATPRRTAPRPGAPRPGAPRPSSPRPGPGRPTPPRRR